MSDLLPSPVEWECRGTAPSAPCVETYRGRIADLGEGLSVRRMLPNRQRRLVGAWCFLDHFGPLTFESAKPLDVPPHPHIGLQTVTWIFRGEVLHKDSLDNEQMIYPGQLNLMTSGRGIAHSEETPPQNSKSLHGVQLWTALPDSQRQVEPAFEHHDRLPQQEFGSIRLIVFLGSLNGLKSAATVYSPLVGAEIAAMRDGSAEIPIQPDFEHALLPIEGDIFFESMRLQGDTLYYLGAGRHSMRIEMRAAAKCLLIGGLPFQEAVLMWWNFVARTADEISEARQQWAEGKYFGEVKRYEGPPLPAPPFIGRPKANPVS